MSKKLFINNFCSLFLYNIFYLDLGKYIYIDINSDIDNVLKLMGTNKIKRLLVKEKDNIVGILSLSDILNYTNNKNIINTYKTIFYIHDNDHSTIAEIDEFYL